MDIDGDCEQTDENRSKIANRPTFDYFLLRYRSAVLYIVEVKMDRFRLLRI
jgi:hypothetical protein